MPRIKQENRSSSKYEASVVHNSVICENKDSRKVCEVKENNIISRAALFLITTNLVSWFF